MLFHILHIIEAVIITFCWECYPLSPIPEPSVVEQEVRHIQSEIIPQLTQKLESVHNKEAAEKVLMDVYTLCTKDRCDYDGLPIYEVNEWWNKLDAMIQTEVSLQNETPAYQCLQRQIERLEAANYYNTPCLKNMINSYVCRTSGKKHIPLIYPSAGLRLLTCLRSTSIDNFYIKNRYLGNTFLMNLYKKLPFLYKKEMLHLHRLAMFNCRERHQYVDVYQLDPDIYHEAHNSYKQNILKSHYSATLSLCIPTFFSHYTESDGYVFDPFVITESEPCVNYHIPLEATPIWDILQWTPEIAQKHPRYTATDRLNANVVQVSLKLAPPCKATYLNLQFVKGKIKRINYSVY